MAAASELADDFGSGADDAQHSARGCRGVVEGRTGTIPSRQIVLLDAAQGLCRGSVAAQDDQLAAHGEEFLDGLARELIDDIERPRTVGCAGIVAQIQIVVLWQLVADAVKDGQSAVAGVEDANGSHLLVESLEFFPRLLCGYSGYWAETLFTSMLRGQPL